MAAAEAKGIPHIPILRAGEEYTSLDTLEVKNHTDGTPLASVSQANAGIIKRDLRRIAAKTEALRAVPVARMLEICRTAGEHFMNTTLPLNSEGDTQTPDDYVAVLSKTSGLPHALCRKNMLKVSTVFEQMPDILRGLTRGMDPSVIDRGLGEHAGVTVCFAPTTDAMGVVLPSNSPGVNSIWMPAIALGVPVVLKPGREEPWTPLRIIQAFIAAGCPAEAFSFYPTDHEGAAAILEGSGRALLFGDESTTRAYAGNPAIQLHGPGRSKVLIGEDAIESWSDYLEVLVDSVAQNGGRSCINASSIFVPSLGDEIADALGRRLAEIEPMSATDDKAVLSAFANPKFAEFIDASIEQGLKEPGAVDVTAKFRAGARGQTLDGAQFLLPTVVRCQTVEHPLACTEFLFPFVRVVEMPQRDMVTKMGKSLVVTAITKDDALIDELLRSKDVARVNLGPVPTSRVEWDQPHEGNLFEFLYERRAIQRADGW
ncbi:MAG: aldehyde dehydrogenase family protein [Planctomycetota bacterium]